MSLQTVMSAVEGKCGRVKLVHGWYRCAHPCSPEGDTRMSFAFRETPDGTVLLASHKPSYSTDACLAALGLTYKDLFPEQDKRDLGTYGPDGSKVTYGYEYTDEYGKPIGRVSRTTSKMFPQASYRDGRLVSGVDSPLPLYLATYVKLWVSEGRTVYLTEGEKDARALASNGVPATSRSGGCKRTPREEEFALLKGADVVIVADKDAPGENAASAVCAVLSKIAKSVSIVEAADGCKDAYDHLAAGHGVEDFVPRNDLVPRGRRVNMAVVKPADPLFLWDDWRYLRIGQPNLLDAKGGSGKTTLSIALACCGSNGRSPVNGPCEKFKTLFYAEEDDETEIRALINDMDGDASMIEIIPEAFPLDAEGLERVDEDLSETGAKLFIFDAAKYYLPRVVKAEFDAPTVVAFMRNIRKLASTHNACPLLIRHFSREATNNALCDHGAGIEQWRNSCRSQLTVLPCPHRRGNSIAYHTKASVRSMVLEPFGCGWGPGGYGFWEPSPTDYERVGYDANGERIKQEKRSTKRAVPYWAD